MLKRIVLSIFVIVALIMTTITFPMLWGKQALAASEDGVVLSNNPGFETGNSVGWTGTWGTVTYDTVNKYKGLYACKINTNAGVYQEVEGLSPSTIYTIKFYGKNTSGSSNTCGVYVKNYGGSEVQKFITGTSYVQYTFTFTTGASSTTAEFGAWGDGSSTIYVDDLYIVLTATNLILNPSFETGNTSWTLWQNAGYVANNANSGANSMEVGELNGSRYQNISSGYTVGETYLLSGWGKVSKQGQVGYLRARCYNSSNSVIETAIVPFFNWLEYSQNATSFVIPSATTSIMVDVYNNGVNYGYAYFDDLILKQCSGKTYYVDSSLTGNDNNNGTSPSTPWNTITKINNTNFSPGTTILFKGGLTFNGNMIFTAADFGTISNPITISSYGTGNATISASTGTGILLTSTYGYSIRNISINGSGTSTNTGKGIYINNDSSAKELKLLSVYNTTITNFQDGIKQETLLDTSTYHRKLSAVNFINNTVYNVKYFGIASAEMNSAGNDRDANGYAIGVNGDTVRNVYCGGNTLHDASDGECWGLFYGGKAKMLCVENNTAYNGHGREGLWHWGGIYSVYQYNTVHDITTNGADGDGINPGAASEVLVQYNYIYNCDGAGILLDEGYGENFTAQNTTTRYNIIHDCFLKFAGDPWDTLYACIAINGKGQNHTIYNNTLVSRNNSPCITIQGAHYDWDPTTTNIIGTNNFKVYNNILSSYNSSPLLAISIASNCTGAINGNLYYTFGGTFRIIKQYGTRTTYGSIEAFRSGTGYETSTGVVGNPNLSNPTGTGNTDYYKITSGSEAINKGINLVTSYGLEVGKVDYFKNTIPKNSVYDIGAHEY